MHKEGTKNCQAEGFNQDVCVLLLGVLPQPLHIPAAAQAVPAPSMAAPQSPSLQR